MTSGSPAGHMLRFAFPLMLTNMGQQLYMIADGAIVGRGVGVRALAAVGAADWSYRMILWTVGGLTQGFATFVARAFGEKNYRKMNKAVAASVILCALIGPVLTALGVAAASLTARLLSFLYCAATIRKIDCIVLDREAWRMDGRMVRSMLLFGLPVALQYVVITLGGMILQSGINLQGSLFIAVRYLSIMSVCFILMHILHVFRNVLQAMGIAVWFLCSGVAEFAARVFMIAVMLPRIGPDALFIAEPAAWLGAMLCVMLPYFCYRKKLLS